MSSTLSSILNTAKTGLFASQGGLSVTGNNIANVNTPGYSRQITQLSSLQLGGVTISGVGRATDQFLNARLLDLNAQVSGNSTLADNLQQMESAMGSTDDSPIGSAMQSFFAALQTLSSNPSGSTERNSLRSNAQQLAYSLNSTVTQLNQMRTEADQQVAQQVGQVNTLTSQIAQINTKINALQGNTTGPTSDLDQLQDQREQLLSQLSSIIPARTITDSQGQMTLFGAGQVLLDGSTVRPLQLRVNQANDGMSDVVIADAAGRLQDISGALSTGSLGALLQSRDTYAKGLIDQVNQLAAGTIRAVNVQHRQGEGLDGVGGRDFFTGLAVSTAPQPTNKGGAAVTASSVTNDALLTFQDYQIQFSAPGTFNVVNTTTGATVLANQPYTAGNAIAFDGMSVTLGNTGGAPAAGDAFNVNSYDGTTARMGLSAAVTASSDAIAAGLTSAAGDNQNVLALAAMAQTPTIGQPPSQSFQNYFDAVRLNLGMAAQTAQQAQASAGVSQQQAQALQQSVSGVSEDEEATNIIQFQRAFQASSKVISVADEMMQSIIQMI